MLPREAKRVPSGSEWAFEIAWDGVRALAPMEGARARFEHGGGDELDERTKHLLARMPRAVRTSECVLDGVICSFDEGVVYVVSDLLDLEGAVAGRPAVEGPARRASTGLLDDHVGEVRLSRAYDDGAALRKAARAQGLGSWPSAATSRYRPGVVSDDWRLLASLITRGAPHTASARSSRRTSRTRRRSLVSSSSSCSSPERRVATSAICVSMCTSASSAIARRAAGSPIASACQRSRSAGARLLGVRPDAQLAEREAERLLDAQELLQPRSSRASYMRWRPRGRPRSGSRPSSS